MELIPITEMAVLAECARVHTHAYTCAHQEIPGLLRMTETLARDVDWTNSRFCVNIYEGHPARRTRVFFSAVNIAHGRVERVNILHVYCVRNGIDFITSRALALPATSFFVLHNFTANCLRPIGIGTVSYLTA